MAVLTGMRTGFSDTEIKRRVVTDAIYMIDWTEAALLKYFGVDNEGMFNFVNFPNRQYEWLQDSMAPTVDALNEGGNIDDNQTEIDVDNGTYFRRGDIILINSERMWVSNVVGNALTVTRGFQGTTPAIALNDAVVTIVGNARPEGEEATLSPTTTVTKLYNMRQILETTIKVSRSQQLYKDYGISDTLSYHLAKAIGGEKIGTKNKAGELAMKLSNIFYTGIRNVASTNALPDAAGGANYFITTNEIVKGGAALQRKDIVDLLQTCYEAGGNPSTLVCGSWVRRKISQMFEGLVRTDRSEKDGGSVIDTIITEFGDINVLWDRWCPPGSAFLVEDGKLGWVTIDPFDVRELPSTGDYVWSEVVGEYGFVLVNENGMGKITGIATTK